jgi:cytochrome c oxidase assembly protein subunit 15
VSRHPGTLSQAPARPLAGVESAASSELYARRLGAGFLALVAVTSALIVLGALVRAHGAGLACPDWPLCFGELVPRFDAKVAFEWAHRVLAGAVAAAFAGLAALALARAGTRRAAAPLLAVGAALLALQILLGALTVWKLLASWSVTSHLVAGNAFNAVLLLTALRLRGRARAPAGPPSSRAARAAATAAFALLALQIVLGGLVSSTYAGLVCPEWPACRDGVWFPHFEGAMGVHLLHRLNAYALAIAVAAFAALDGRASRGYRLGAVALALVLAQIAVGALNVLWRLPVEVTGLHSALAAGLVLALTLALRHTWRRPARGAAPWQAREIEA